MGERSEGSAVVMLPRVSPGDGWSVLEEPSMTAVVLERDGEGECRVSRGLGGRLGDGGLLANIVGPYQFLLGIAYRSWLNVNLPFACSLYSAAPSLYLYSTLSLNSKQQNDICNDFLFEVSLSCRPID